MAPSAGVACVLMLYFTAGSDGPRVPIFNIALSLLPTLSVGLLLWLLDESVEASQPQVCHFVAAKVALLTHLLLLQPVEQASSL